MHELPDVAAAADRFVPMHNALNDALALFVGRTASAKADLSSGRYDKELRVLGDNLRAAKEMHDPPDLPINAAFVARLKELGYGETLK